MPNSNGSDPTYCPECGQVGIYHPIYYITSALEHVFSPVVAPLLSHVRSSWFENLKTASFVQFTRIAEHIGWGTFLNAPDEHTLLLTQVLWEAAPSRGVTMREFRLAGLARNSMVATLPGGTIIDFDAAPKPATDKPVWWVNNKWVLKKKLTAAGVPVPKGGVVATVGGLKKMFDTLETPLVVKPVIGSASRHTTMHIAEWEPLMKAFKSAQRLSPFVMVEEELRGAVYRPTLVGGKLIATLKREQPGVMGNGVHSLGELVEEENKHPKRAGPYFFPIQPKNVDLGYVPYTGERIQLHPKINWSVGGTTTDVTDEVHEENKKLFERVAALLNTSLVGLDFIIEDIGKPWQEQRCGVIEANTMPYFDNHHLPFYGKPQDVAGPFWDMVLKEKE